MALSPGTTLGSYEIVALIGAGGMGEVYRAKDTNLKREVAIKVLPDAVATDAERLVRFQREAEVLARLNHPNIAQIHGLEKSHGMTALVMELVEGPTLADRIAQGPIPLHEALPIAKQIAEALENAHEHAIIHRDLKPANIKLRFDGTVKVLDFGLAKAFATDKAPASAGLTISRTITGPAGVSGIGVLLGTAAYMPPEQARAKPVDKRADIWAFGCVLFEMLTGTQAFSGQDLLETLAHVIERDPDWTALPTSLPPIVRAFLQKCLEKDPARRIRDVGDVRLALDGAFDTAIFSAHASTGRPRISRRALPWIAGLMLGTLIGLALWQLRPVTSNVVTRFEVPLANFGGSPGAHLVSIAPDGQSVFYVENQDGRTRIMKRDLLDLSWSAVTGTDGAEAAPFFAPDGRSMGFVTDSLRAIKTVPRSGGPAIPVVRTAERLYSPVWTPNGTILFGSDSGIWRVAARGGTPELLAKTNATAAGPHLLPGGERLLFHVGTTSEYSIEVLTIATGEHRKIGEGMYPLFVAGQLLFIHSDNSVWSVPFNVDRAEPSGSPAPIPLSLFRRAGDIPLAVSSNGTLVYVPGAAVLGRRLTWVDTRGNEKQTDIAGADYGYPRISPDGKKLTVANRSEIWVIDLERSTRTRIVSSDQVGTRNVVPMTAWTPDSLRVTFNRGPQDPALPSATTLEWRLADAGMPAEEIIRSDSALGPGSWARNGIAFAYHSARPGRSVSVDSDVWVLQRSTRMAALPWLATPAHERAPAFSPDGEWIAYVSDDSGQDQVYVQSYAEPGRRQTVSKDGGVEPVWARNGRELFYRNGSKMMAVSVRDGSSLVLGPARVVFDRPYMLDGTILRGFPNYDVSADGRFLMVALPTPDRLVVVQNWTEELKRLLPSR